jgi:antitoxin FitA
VQSACIAAYDVGMKVIQIRGVPDDVHKKLVEAADVAGKSLTRYLSDELRRIAERGDAVRHNREVILAAQAKIKGNASRADILEALHEGRAERTDQLLRNVGHRPT